MNILCCEGKDGIILASCERCCIGWNMQRLLKNVIYFRGDEVLMADEQDVKGAEEGATPKKKSKLPLLLLSVVLVLLLAGGGFYAYTTFLTPKAGPEQQMAGVKPEQLTDTVGEMFPLDQFVVNLADPQGKRYLRLTITLELESPEAVERATKMVPKLRDMVIVLLTSLTFEEVMTPEGKVQIRDELLERFNQILRPDRVRNIYFTDFVVQ